VCGESGCVVKEKGCVVREKGCVVTGEGEGLRGEGEGLCGEGEGLRGEGEGLCGEGQAQPGARARDAKGPSACAVPGAPLRGLAALSISKRFAPDHGQTLSETALRAYWSNRQRALRVRPLRRRSRRASVWEKLRPA
jgi:hypothetical protein